MYATEAQNIKSARVISIAVFRLPYGRLGHHSRSQMLPKGRLQVSRGREKIIPLGHLKMNSTLSSFATLLSKLIQALPQHLNAY